MSAISFEDYFEVKAINKDGTFFDRGRLKQRKKKLVSHKKK